MRRFLEQKLKLKVNEEKSKIGRPGKLKFLGIRLFKRKGEAVEGVARVAVKRCRECLRHLTRCTRSGPLDEVLREINAFERGWVGYFRIADSPSVFQELDEW